MNFRERVRLKNNDVKNIGLILGIAAALFIILFVDFGSEDGSQKLMAAVSALMALWWITEAVPLAATSLIPLVLFPLFGIVSGKQTANAYINSTIFLFMGGFIIALAMERWGLHKRIALNLISVFGKSPAQIVLGFMIASAFISMWISNTATAVMILPIALAILYKLEDQFGREKTKNFSIALMLGIAYACSVGGIGTLIGTPPNLVFKRVYAINFPGLPEMHFGQWMIFAVPLSIIMLLIVWFLLTKVFHRSGKDLIIDKTIIKEEKLKLGKITYEEKVVMIIFTFAAFLWIFRKKLELGIITIPGWSQLFAVPDFIDDGTVAITMSLILFLIPVKNKANDRFRILDAGVIRKIPWEIILLFGGGFALAEGFVETGLSELIGSRFAGLGDVPLLLIILSICLSITFLTELTSNTATAQIILPILASLSIHLNIEPLVLMIPATLSASMAFMMPVATPPNAIIFSSQRVKVYEMAKVGFFFNLLGAVFITLFVYYFIG